jgi:hypothetical protein
LNPDSGTVAIKATIFTAERRWVIASRYHAKRSQAKPINRDEGDKGDNKYPRIIVKEQFLYKATFFTAEVAKDAEEGLNPD